MTRLITTLHTKDSIDSKYLLVSGTKVNFLNIFLQDRLLLAPAIILTVFFWMRITILLSGAFTQKIIP
jgi:hypothetical protein